MSQQQPTYYCSEKFFKGSNNPGMLIWDPLSTKVACDANASMVTEDQFRYQCKKHGLTVKPAQVGPMQECVGHGKGNGMALMCTKSDSDWPWCTQ